MKERSAFLGELLLNSGKRIHPQLPLPSRILDLVGLIEEMHPSIHTLNHDVHPVVSGLIVVVVKMQRRYPARRSRRPSSIFPFRDDKVLSDLTCNIPCKRRNVLEGRLHVRVGTALLEVRAGSAVVVPRGTAHTYCNPDPTTVRYLLVMTSNIYALIREIHSTADRVPATMRIMFEK